MSGTESESSELQFGRFRALEILGRGGMGRVYLAEDPVIGRKVAIKVVRAEPGLEEDELRDLNARFEREFQSAGTLSHPNIVTVYDVGQEGEDTFIAMEFLPGDSWGDVLKTGGRLSYGDVADFAMKITSALDYAHVNGIVHRDIKPTNILIARDGEPKITDFGVAKLTSTNLTRTGTVVGTPSYMSPEQITGADISGASDQFSVAVILYQMLTGKLPFVGENPTTILYKIVHDEPAPPDQDTEDLPAGVGGVLLKALAKDPAERFATCSQLGTALRDALGVAMDQTLDFDLGHLDPDDGLTLPTGTPPIAEPKRRRQGLLPALLFALTIVVVFAALYYRDVLFPTGPREDPSQESVQAATALAPVVFQVESDREGARIWVDDADTGAVVPGQITLEGDLGDEKMLELRRDEKTVARTTLVMTADMPTSWHAVEAIPPETFAIASTPQGAEVYLNDELAAGLTPTEIELADGESYRIRVELPTYRTASLPEFSFPDGLEDGIRQNRRFFFPLQPRIPPGVVQVESAYPVTVQVEGAKHGPGRSVELEMAPNTYQIRLLSADIFLDEQQTIRVDSSQTIRIDAPAAIDLRIATSPSNSRVFVNGKYLGDAPFDQAMVPGIYEFRFEWPGSQNEPGSERELVENITITRSSDRVFRRAP